MLKGTIYQKVLLRITTSLSIDQLIYSTIKWYEEMRKLTTWPGEDSTRGCLWDYDCIGNCYRLTVLDLSRQKNRCSFEGNSSDRIPWKIKKY